MMFKPYYQDSAVTIYHGDCREIVPTLGRFDLLLTDPPYGINENAFKVANRGKLAAATDYGDFDWDKSPVPQDIMDMCVSRAHLAVVWGGNYYHFPPSRAWLVWDKQNTGGFADCELAWSTLNTAVRMFRFMWNGMLRAGEARGVRRVHPTQKPVELMTWCISLAGDAQTILDPFAGSGTTGRAAKDMGRKCTLIEREERYCEIAAKRMSQEVFEFVNTPALSPETTAD